MKLKKKLTSHVTYEGMNEVGHIWSGDEQDTPHCLRACDVTHEWVMSHMKVQPIADRVAQNLEIVSKNFQFSTRRTRILMGFMISTIYHVVLIVNFMGRILVR